MNRSLKLVAYVPFVALLLAAIAAPASAAPAGDTERLAKAIQAVQGWEYGQKADDMNYVAGEVVKAARDAGPRKAMEARIIAGLAGAKTRGARDFFCRQLVLVGNEAAVPELAKLLTDEESSHMGRYALERIPGKAVDEALLKALPAVNDRLKVGMVFSLGRRGCKEAVGPIAALLTAGGSRELQTACLAALGRIDSDAAVAAVAKARDAAPKELRAAATNAYLDCAERLAAGGKAAEAQAIYQKLFAPSEPSTCRIAALRGMVTGGGGAKGMAPAIAALGDADEKVQQAAAMALRDVPGKEVTAAIAAELARRDEKVQTVLLGVLADRADRSALPAVVQAASSQAEPVRLAALQALGTVGDATVVPMLAERAVAAAQRAEQDAARGSLDRLSPEGVDAAIAKGLAGPGDAKVRAELARSLGARRATGAADDLLKAAGDKDAAVRAEAMKSLRGIAGPAQVPALVAFLLGALDEPVRTEAERTAVAAARQIEAKDKPAAAILAALPKAGSSEAKASLVRVLGMLADAAALPTLYEAAKDADAAVKDAAIRGLADWPDAAPIRVLLGIAEDKAATEVHRVLALRGFIGMIARQQEVSDDQILADYAKALDLAARAPEKQLVLSKLANLRHRGAIDMARRCEADPELKAAAQAAIAKIEKLLSAPAKVTASHNPDAAGNANDGKADTRWDTAAVMKGGEWFRIDLDEDRLISAVILDTKGSGGDYPRGYEVFISKSTLSDGKLAAKGKGSGPVTEIKFAPPVVGRSIKIVQTGSTEGSYWSIHELTVKSEPAPK